ncbi:MAG: tyrosine recombinase XerC [Betaproteobacteria bacterium]|nr:tyrosine recombinase XerC [Betaproteobacteria bacterium]
MKRRGAAAATGDKAAPPSQARSYAGGFLAHLSSERRLSPHTCANYGRDLEVFLKLAGAAPLGELTVHQVRRFAAQLHGRGLSGRSIARMLSAWRGFYAWLARKHGFKGNPCLGLKAPRAPKTLPHALSPDEMARLLEIPESDPLALRDKAMFELFYSSGLRLSELTNLKPEDLDFGDGTVRVTGKGAKTRVVPVGSVAAAVLRRWLDTRAALVCPGERALFLNRRGRALGPRSIQARLKYWARRQGISANVHPHALRHSFASHVLQSCGDLRAVQEMLGHASISTTQVYTHLDFQHLAKVYDAAHPRAKKKK